MRINIFTKTFLMLLVSFSAVFFLTIYIIQSRFGTMYIDENIDAVKQSVLISASAIRSGAALEDTDLINLSSDTTFLHYQISQGGITDVIGPSYLEEDDILSFVIEMYDNEEAVIEGNLTYYTEQVEDVFRINYIYEYEFGDYLIVSTRIQALTNVDRVLQNINLFQSVFMFIVIILLSAIISRNIAKPLKKINEYATDVSNLQFDSPLSLHRNDEFRDLVSSLNEMTFNLQKAYTELENANAQLSDKIDYEQQQEEQKKHFIMTINHEIKTPLSVMKGTIEGMIDQVGKYKDRDYYLKDVLTQIDTIERITDELTYTLRLEDKVKQGNHASSSIITEVIDELQPLAQKQMIKIQSLIEPVSLLINDELFHIIATNVIKNAIYYTRDNAVHVEGINYDGYYHFMVKNKGEIAAEELQKIFESFTRFDHKNDYQKGSGVGLFVVAKICSLYQYEYKVFNDNGTVVVKIIIPKKNS